MTSFPSYDKLFHTATGNHPYPYQRHLAEGAALPDLLGVPTGLGKTEAAILAWLWRRRLHPSPDVRAATPRRLVYCLPMRVLVEQTADRVDGWLRRLGLDAEDGVALHVLLGGRAARDWIRRPEDDAILVGTQDMLLSRALNRGYASGRARWPVEFGLLHNDALWVLDEPQLMGSGLVTTAQLAGLRRRFATYGEARSLWMSATIERSWLATVDHDCAGLEEQQLSPAERELPPAAVGPLAELRRRLNAPKTLARASHTACDPKDHAALASEIRAAHRPGGLTLVVLNTVARAVALHRALAAGPGGKRPHGAPSAGEPAPPELVLIHSRFRPPDRDTVLKQILSPLPPAGRIVVSTQVVEAGVDLSASVLVTELAPWASIVQRLGRLNRKGERAEAQALWCDVPDKDAAPYDPTDLAQAREELLELEGAPVGPAYLPTAPLAPPSVRHVLRAVDLVDLFDTTADLAGNDLDVSRFIREGDDHDAYVYWRDLGDGPPAERLPPADRDELCPVPVGAFREFVRGLPERARALHVPALAWQFDAVDEEWRPLLADSRDQPIVPGRWFLLDARAGGYDPGQGWTGAQGTVAVIAPPERAPRDHDEADTWQTIAEHTDQVCRELAAILVALPDAASPNGAGDDSSVPPVEGPGVSSPTGLRNGDRAALSVAARWHDRGKAHPVFQAALPGTPPGPGAYAKAPGKFSRYTRPRFRHELASALAALAAGKEDLAAYLIAAHHGKVRLSLRSLPDEARPPSPGRRFARGVWDDDELPETRLGAQDVAPPLRLRLDVMELGVGVLTSDGTESDSALSGDELAPRTDCERRPDEAASWTERVLRLRDRLGPFRLAYLEALLRAADGRGSARAGAAPSVTTGEGMER